MTRVREGDRVRMTGLMPDDPDPVPIGTTGTVREVNLDVGQVYVDWDVSPDGRRRTLILLTTDPFEVTS